MATDEQICPPCRGTGQVISNLGGTRSTVTCPWCEGTGRLTLEHDAQARWKSVDAPSS
jgi:DnaJ-class molecular chaperone